MTALHKQIADLEAKAQHAMSNDWIHETLNLLFKIDVLKEKLANQNAPNAT